jgi:hypothetical protein
VIGGVLGEEAVDGLGLELLDVLEVDLPLIAHAVLQEGSQEIALLFREGVVERIDLTQLLGNLPHILSTLGRRYRLSVDLKRCESSTST